MARCIHFAFLVVLLLDLRAWAAPGWYLAKDEHFEIYSQSSLETARTALVWFEQLRVFFERQTGLTLDNRPPVRVIGFDSRKAYEAYQIHAASDAYFAGTETRDYVVMAELDAGQFHVAAHEYLHLILHAAKLKPPPWLDEGLAELFSTVRLGERGSTLGGDLPAQSQLLRRQLWMPLDRLLTLSADAPEREDRDRAALFYAQSWALTELLFLSPEYGPQFPALMTALTMGATSQDAIAKAYGRSLETITRDLHAWTARRAYPSIPLPGIVLGTLAVEVSEVPPLASRALLADLLHVSGELDRAAAAYRELVHETPENPDLHAALGEIALRKGDFEGARENWKRAIEHGIRDAKLCYEYAVLAGMAGLPPSDIQPALEQAVTLRPGYDDALYNLALLEKNAQRYQDAVNHLRQMRKVTPARAFSYWSALADAYNELGKRDEAKAAAQQAGQHATTRDERLRAGELAYIAQTDVTVRFARDKDGRQQMVTTRVPHDTLDFNPFIEPEDQMRRVEGWLRNIDCSGAATRISVEAAGKRVTLVIADPSRVQMRHAPDEFTCGPQKSGTAVIVDYAAGKTTGADGVVRGIEFRQ